MSAEASSKVLSLKAKDVIGDWVIIKKLGKGGCGAVFEVAPKVLLLSSLSWYLRKCKTKEHIAYIFQVTFTETAISVDSLQWSHFSNQKSIMKNT